MSAYAGRHPSVAHFEPLFAYSHLPWHLQDVSREFSELAEGVVSCTPDGPELAAGLRKILEAKDCIVRAVVLAHSG